MQRSQWDLINNLVLLYFEHTLIFKSSIFFQVEGTDEAVDLNEEAAEEPSVSTTESTAAQNVSSTVTTNSNPSTNAMAEEEEEPQMLLQQLEKIEASTKKESKSESKPSSAASDNNGKAVKSEANVYIDMKKSSDTPMVAAGESSDGHVDGTPETLNSDLKKKISGNTTKLKFSCFPERRNPDLFNELYFVQYIGCFSKNARKNEDDLGER